MVQHLGKEFGTPGTSGLNGSFPGGSGTSGGPGGAAHAMTLTPGDATNEADAYGGGGGAANDDSLHPMLAAAS